MCVCVPKGRSLSGRFLQPHGCDPSFKKFKGFITVPFVEINEETNFVFMLHSTTVQPFCGWRKVELNITGVRDVKNVDQSESRSDGVILGIIFRT